jgi:hypothetical protein
MATRRNAVVARGIALQVDGQIAELNRTREEAQIEVAQTER